MRSFAIVPAAGASRRMGQPKLLMPWRGSTVIRHILDVWAASCVHRTVVVVRPGCEQLAEIARQAGASVVVPVRIPQDMKASVGFGLEHVMAHFRPANSDIWLLCPADIPGLTVRTIDRILDTSRAEPGKIVVPTHNGGRGHPVAFPWPLADGVGRLGVDEGINVLLGRNPVLEFDVDDPGILNDLDTPDDYDRLNGCGRF